MSRLAPLRSLADYLATGAPVPEQDRGHLAEGLARFLAGEATILEEALGIREAGSQGRTPQFMAALDERDRLLREAARDFLPDLLEAHQARELHRRWTLYEASGWRRGERSLPVAPAHGVGTLEGRLWAVLRLRDNVLGERTIRRTLAMGRAYSLPSPSPTLAPED